MDAPGMLKRAVIETDRLVMNTTTEDLAATTPCTEWSVRDLINHLTAGATIFAVSAETGSVPDELMGQLMGGDVLGDDYKAAWSAASQRAVAAFEAPDVLDKTLKLPFGEMPAPAALSLAIFDVTTHATDLAVATGQDIEDESLIEAALAMGKQMVGPQMRQPGVFAAEQAIGDDAPIVDRLQAFAGRTV